jgi:predicted nuclease of restriction endonuclease-like (RecB) superfamily
LFLSDIPYDRLKAIQFVIPDKETKAKTKKGLTKSQKEKQAKLVEEHPMTPDESVQEPQIPENIKVEEKHDDTEYTGDIDNIIEQALGE